MYGDHIYDNSGFHLHIGIGSALDMLCQTYHKMLIPYSQRLYDVPSGKAGKEFTNEVATIFDDILDWKRNIEKLMVFFPVILQKVPSVKAPTNVRKRILSRLAQWRDGKFKGLVEDTHKSLKAAQCKSHSY